MQFFKKLVRGLAWLLLIFLLFNTALVTALILTFNSPQKIEKSLSDSGVYSSFVTNALNEAQKSAQNDKSNNTGDIPINDPAIVAAANKAFTPQLLQSTTENVLNGTYVWLKGKSPQPTFVVDLTQAKQTFAQAVGEAAKNRLASLPVCTKTQLKAMGANADIDAFSVTCRPPKLNIIAQQQKITNDLATSKDFIGTPKLTPQNLPKDSQGQTIFDKASVAPKIYKWANASPWIMIVLTLAVGTICVFLYRSKRRSIRKLAIVLTVVGSIVVVGNIGSAQAFNQLNKPNGQLGAAVKGNFQPTIIKALSSISHSIEQTILIFGLVYLILGVGTLVALKFIKSKDQPPKNAKADKEPTPPIDDSPNKTAPKPATKPVPKPKSIQG